MRGKAPRERPQRGRFPDLIRSLTCLRVLTTNSGRSDFSEFCRRKSLGQVHFFVEALDYLCSRELCTRRRATALEAHRRKPRELRMRRIIAAFIKDQAGATAIEYGLIAAGISIAIIVAVNGIGVTLNGTFTNVNTQLR